MAWIIYYAQCNFKLYIHKTIFNIKFNATFSKQKNKNMYFWEEK